ncbi:MAG: Bax inhibitor-1/YccA family protein [Beutenbergiaceae bacterium]
MANPYFTNSANFGRSQPQAGMTAVGYQPDARGYAQGPAYGTAPTQGAQGPAYGTAPTQGLDPQMQGIQDAYYGPTAGPAQTGRLTYDDVIVKTAAVLGTIVATAAVAWLLVPYQLTMPVMGIGLLGGLILGLVNSFKKEPSPALILGYAIFEGAFLGLISKFFELAYPGIVLQAVLATFITFGVTLALFRSGKVRVTPKFTKFLLIGVISYSLFGLINLGMMLFTDVGGAFGMRSIEIAGLGIPLGLVIGLFAVVLAAMTLIMDFDQIQRGVRNGVPSKFAWSAAFGIALSLVWLYLEFLRLLAILRGGD